MPRHEMETFNRATHNACRYALRLPLSRLILESCSLESVAEKEPELTRDRFFARGA